jgi:hypothetical protein
MDYERVFIAREALHKLKRLSKECAGITLYEGIAIYDSPHFPMFRRNGDIVWGVLIINTGYMVYLVEEIYQITTA